MVEALSPVHGAATATEADPAVRKIRIADVRTALAEGWRDFLDTPTHLVFLAAIYPIIGIAFASAAAGRELLPLLWPLTAGFALVGPIAALGIYELSRQREQGRQVSVLNAFDVFRSPGIGSIIVLGVVLLAIFVAWVVVAQKIYLSSVGPEGPSSIGDLLRLTFHTPEGLRLLLLGNLAGFLFAVVVLATTVVSFPLLLDRNVGPVAAVGTSVRAVLKNPVPMALWGLIVALLLFLGSLPLFIGLAAIMPILGHATWHLYRKVVA